MSVISIGVGSGQGLGLGRMLQLLAHETKSNTDTKHDTK